MVRHTLKILQQILQKVNVNTKILNLTIQFLAI